jgi:hypothetical protein
MASNSRPFRSAGDVVAKQLRKDHDMTPQGVGHRRFVSVLAGALALVSSATAAFAQSNGADAAFQQLRSEVPGLRADWNFETGYPSFVYGRAIKLFGAPRTDAEYEAVARQFVDSYPALFGYDSAVLNTDGVRHIKLAQIGTTDKTAVNLSQWVGGLPVKNGTLNFLFNSDGAIVGIENKGLADVASLDVVPTIDESAATRIALAAFDQGHATVVGLEIAIVPDAKNRAAALAWIVELRAGNESEGLPVQERFSIDAHNGAVLHRENTICTFTDITGTSNGWVNVGENPFTGPGSRSLEPSWWMHVLSSVGNTSCDSTGAFDIAYSGSSNQTVTFNFDSGSTYTWVTAKSGADYTKSKIFVPGTPGTIRQSIPGTEYATAQLNAAYHGVIFREWIRALDSSDNIFDIRQHLNVNIKSTCNAYYDGSSTNYYRAGGGCVNTAYSTVVYHETGHWANDKYGSGNGGDGFGEGSADTWAMYIIDSPIVGKDFCGSGCNVRSGTNTRQYCGSCAAGCYGEVHSDGEVLMGALWKVRDHLDQTNGDASGDAIADTLFHSWYVTYDASTICKSNLSQWLTLDDDDGNLSNGTPHSADINQGYVDQGYPSYY